MQKQNPTRPVRLSTIQSPTKGLSVMAGVDDMVAGLFSTIVSKSILKTYFWHFHITNPILKH